MTKEEKDLLILDLSARSPYNVKVHNTTFKDPQIQTLKGVIGDECVMQETYLETSGHSVSRTKNYNGLIEFVKPYLRPMSSMTEEEKSKYEEIAYNSFDGTWFSTIDPFDYLNSIHVDYRGLIPKGLALEALEGMYDKKDYSGI